MREPIGIFQVMAFLGALGPLGPQEGDTAVFNGVPHVYRNGSFQPTNRKEQNKNMNKNQYRQGDVLIEKVDSIPTHAKKRKRDKGRVILAYGEVTGHAHAIKDSGCALLECDGEEYLQAEQDVQLKHEEHATIDLPKANYRIVHQREYSPEEIRNVRD